MQICEEKFCKACLETKPLSEFGKNAVAKDGAQYYCKVCMAERAREKRKNNPGLATRYYHQNKEDQREKNRLRHLRNKSRDLARSKANYQVNKEEVKQKAYLPVTGKSAEEYSLRLTIEELPEISSTGHLTVECAYCRRRFSPSRMQVKNRVAALEGRNTGEARIYCSDGCKTMCPVYWKRPGDVENILDYNPFGAKRGYRSDQGHLREMALDLYGKECARCGETENLVCHHIDPVKCNPIESMDLDNVVILCEDCHEESHKLPKCGKSYLAHVQ